ncbi:hypothetical protein AB0D11_22905 [Streptomyces monashensis]
MLTMHVAVLPAVDVSVGVRRRTEARSRSDERPTVVTQAGR